VEEPVVVRGREPVLAQAVELVEAREAQVVEQVVAASLIRPP